MSSRFTTRRSLILGATPTTLAAPSIQRASGDGGELKVAILERCPSHMAAGWVDIQTLFQIPKT